MKLPIALAFATLLASWAVRPYVSLARNWYDTRYLAATDARADRTATTVILGASVIARWPERAPESYAATFGDEGVQNLGKRAWTTERMRAQLPMHAPAAKRIIVDLGRSDLPRDRSPLDTAIGIAAVVESLLATTDAHVYVLAVLPFPDLEAEVEETNLWTAALLDEAERVTFVDVHVPLDPHHMLEDGLHPNAVGYAVLGEAVRRAF
jgi:lysophospholipase L1-like esterase